MKVRRAEALRIIAAWFEVEAEQEDDAHVAAEVRRMASEGVSDTLRDIADGLTELDGPA